MYKFILAVLILVSSFFVSRGEAGLAYEDLVFDFGYVAIDFSIFHAYKYVNSTDHPVTITDVEVNCDCSTVSLSDSLLEPGDTAFFNLAFSTRDYFGLTSKSFKVSTDDPRNPSFEFFYLSTVGQWFHGFKPHPVSLFFLPTKKNMKVSVPNVKFDDIKVRELIAHDSTFGTRVLKNSADKGEKLEIEVFPAEGLGRGTYLSTLTIIIDVSGEEKPTILSIPTKIVRY